MDALKATCAKANEKKKDEAKKKEEEKKKSTTPPASKPSLNPIKPSCPLSEVMHKISGANPNVQDEHVKTMTQELVVKPGEPGQNSAHKITALEALTTALKAQADRHLDYHKRSMASLDTA